jgi:hypothetical protein
MRSANFVLTSSQGGGTYGVVWSVTARAHPDVPTVGSVVTFQAGGNVSMDAFWAGVAAYRAVVPSITSAGGMAAAVYEAGAFELWPFFLPNGTVSQAKALLAPFLAALDHLAIPYNASTVLFPGYYPAYTTLENPALFVIQATQQGSRLLPKSLWSSNRSLNALDSAVRTMLEDGAGAFDIAVAPARAWNYPSNSVLPAWRNATTSFVVFTYVTSIDHRNVAYICTRFWNQTGTPAQAYTQQKKITNAYVPSLKALSPGSGAYLNEARRIIRRLFTIS